VSATARDPRIDRFSPEGQAVREREIRTAVRMRRQGYFMEEIAQALGYTEDQVRTFVKNREPRLLADGKQFHAARRGRELAARERDVCGPQTFLVRASAVVVAQKQGDTNVLIGSLDDLAAAALAWADRLRAS
jgi:hypothetical protein